MSSIRLLALAATLALGGCQAAQPLKRFESTRLCMGVQARVIVFGPDQAAAQQAMADAYALISRLEASMSDYRDDSEIARLAAAAPDWIHVSDDLLTVLTIAGAVAEETGGAFDATLGPLSRLWREARNSGRLPEQNSMIAARSRIGWKFLALDAVHSRAALHMEGMSLDLGGIAKGYAAQQAANVLRERGHSRCLVALAGDIALGDAPPHSRGWHIAAGSDQPGSEPIQLRLSNCCISTSGDTQQFMVIGGIRRSHIVDPRTGLGITVRRSVTVAANDGAAADATATAICVSGEELAKRLASSRPIAVIIDEVHDDDAARRTIIDPHQLLDLTSAP